MSEPDWCSTVSVVIDQVRASAYHEAGHAVVARHTGYEVRSVSVDGQGLGRCVVRHDGYDVGSIACTMAGWFAECMAHGEDWTLDQVIAGVDEADEAIADRDEDMMAVMGDMLEVAELLQLHNLTAEMRAMLIRLNYEQARDILREHWHEVEDEAVALLAAS